MYLTAEACILGLSISPGLLGQQRVGCSHPSREGGEKRVYGLLLENTADSSLSSFDPHLSCSAADFHVVVYFTYAVRRGSVSIGFLFSFLEYPLSI